MPLSSGRRKSTQSDGQDRECPARPKLLTACPNALCRATSATGFLSVIGLYATCFILWWAWRSESMGLALVSLDNVQRSRQLRRRPVGEAGNRNIVPRKQWTQELLKSSGRPPDLRCISWKPTGSCDPAISDVSSTSRGCDQFVRGGAGSGYCLMKNEATGQQIQVMHTACTTLHPSVTLSCRYAGDFVDLQWKVATLSAKIEMEKGAARKETRSSTASTSHACCREGIVMVIYPKLLVSAYASIRAIRALNCTLPVELWYVESEMVSIRGTSLLDGVPQTLRQEYGPISLQPIADARVADFNSKVYAVIHSKFEYVLYLDADNVPVKDPSCLFRSREFLQMGAIFWPDFWHPAHTIFRIDEGSMLWELLDMPYIDMFEQESGQFAIDKTRSSAALRMLSLLAFHEPNLFSRYKLVHGDKDLFRLAWLKTGTPFHMVSNPPSIAGTVRETKFCGMTMVQFDTDGEVLFLHRNSKKLTGGLDVDRNPDKLIWTHLQHFRYRAASPHDLVEAAFVVSKPIRLPNDQTGSAHVSADNLNIPYDVLRKMYTVSIFAGAPEFADTQWCYGQSTLTTTWCELIAWQDTMFPEVENGLLHYASEAVALLPASAIELIVQSN